MIQTVNRFDFRRGFEECRPNNFSYDGLLALFEYFERYEDDCDTQIEFDVIGICCEYTEYKDFKEFQANYQDDDIKCIDDIEDYTQVIRINKESFIILDY
jgi:hypothetical protein